MKICDLSQGLGISRQMIGKLKKQGMPVDSLEAAIEWRNSNLNPFRSKTGRIDGNSGKPRVSTQDNNLSEKERNAIESTLEKTVPELYFQRIDWLASAFKETGITANGEQLMEVQDILFSIYLEEIAYKLSRSETSYPLPPLFMMRLASKERKEVIASIDEMLMK